MGLRFRKSVKIAPGVKLNLNKKIPVFLSAPAVRIIQQIPQAEASPALACLAQGFLTLKPSTNLPLATIALPITMLFQTAAHHRPHRVTAEMAACLVF